MESDLSESQADEAAFFLFSKRKVVQGDALFQASGLIVRRRATVGFAFALPVFPANVIILIAHDTWNGHLV